MKNCQTEATFFEHLLSINVLAAYVCVRASHNDALLLGGRSRLINKMSALVLFFLFAPPWHSNLLIWILTPTISPTPFHSCNQWTTQTASKMHKTMNREKRRKKKRCCLPFVGNNKLFRCALSFVAGQQIEPDTIPVQFHLFIKLIMANKYWTVSIFDLLT